MYLATLDPTLDPPPSVALNQLFTKFEKQLGPLHLFYLPAESRDLTEADTIIIRVSALAK